MNADVDVQNLESALLERAQHLADEALELGRQSRDRILREENERLELREEREVLVAKAMAERSYRQRVQANELKVQEQLDRVRWSLVQEALEQVRAQLRQLVDKRQAYEPVLQQMIREAVAAIGQYELVVELNQRDRDWLAETWDAFCGNLATDKRMLLSESCHNGVGGARILSLDRSMQVDNTFEGRIERLQDHLYEVIIERMFGKAMEMDELIHG